LLAFAPIAGVRKLGVAASSRQLFARPSLTQRIAGTAQLAVAGALGGAAAALGLHLASATFGDVGYEDDDRHIVRGIGDLGFPLVELFRLREVIEAIPGVTSMAFGYPVPGEHISSATVSVPSERDADTPVVAFVGTIEA